MSEPESERYLDIERALTEDWKEIFQVSSLDVNAHFFDLGGDSLMAMRCMVRIRSRFEVDVLLDEFFLDDASIVKFAKLVDSALRDAR